MNNNLPGYRATGSGDPMIAEAERRILPERRAGSYDRRVGEPDRRVSMTLPESSPWKRFVEWLRATQ